jgi:hypothetical protein
VSGSHEAVSDHGDPERWFFWHGSSFWWRRGSFATRGQD